MAVVLAAFATVFVVITALVLTGRCPFPEQLDAAETHHCSPLER